MKFTLDKEISKRSNDLIHLIEILLESVAIKRLKTYTEDDKICHDCVGEDYLSKEIETNGKRGKCAFCGQVTKIYTVLNLTNRIEEVMLEHYEKTPDQPSDWEYHMQFADKESTYQWYREGQTLTEILTNEFDIVEPAAAVIEEVLDARHYDMDAYLAGEEPEFGSEVQYEIKGISDARWSQEWRNFEQILKTEARFFSQKVNNILDSIFDGLNKFKSWSGKPVLTTIGPGQRISSLYRARVFQSRNKLLEALCTPDILIGSPKSLFAMSGRMNARGISVFYGAVEELVALSEVRPPVGSKVAVARFDILKPLQLLDLRELKDVREMVSVFDPQYLNKMGKAMFLRRLGEKMTVPVMPDDEVFDYLPTQAIADYLSSRTDINYDGIIYPSVQVAEEKINVVLFHKAARVTTVELPAGTRLEADDVEYEEDGPYESYRVFEYVKRRKKKMSTDTLDESDSIDIRESALRIDLASINVHEIKSVQYETNPHSVSRIRINETKRSKPLDFDF